MEPAELARLGRLVKLSLGLNAVVLVANAVLFYALLVFVVDEPAEVAGVIPLESQAAARDETDPRAEMRDFFDRTSDLLDRMARKNGANPADFLPTEAQIEAAVETRTIHSDQSQAVMQRLREGYDTFDLEWPIVVPQR